MLKKTCSGILAGLLISLGGTVFLSCQDKVVGSVGFTIGLLAVCFYGANLYTGRIGYLFDKHDKDGLTDLVFGLLGNLIGTVCCGLLLGPMKGEAARALCDAKLGQAPSETLLRAAFCGMLVYIAVNLFRDKKTVLGIVIGIPVFILSGFEHSIADAFYFAAAGTFSGQAALFILLVLLGNSIGALLFDRLLKGAGLKKQAS
ncbi:MAG: formate/nitrite transporter family protein [Lachnospiraceae bacterium]|nr:formate/nitrite transporter family protein [Lachnospiraceae bacterium]